MTKTAVVVSEIFGCDQVGSIAGNNLGTLSQSYAYVNMHGTYHVGGLIGYNTGTASMFITYGGITSVTGIYTQQFGGLKVNITPTGVQ